MPLNFDFKPDRPQVVVRLQVVVIHLSWSDSRLHQVPGCGQAAGCGQAPGCGRAPGHCQAAGIHMQGQCLVARVSSENLNGGAVNFLNLPMVLGFTRTIYTLTNVSYN